MNEQLLTVEGYRSRKLLGGFDWRFRVVDTHNGQILAHGQGYSRKIDMMHTVKRLFPDAIYVDVDK
jgi:uncharacterized protein YegP (UPF0339 family)